MPVGCKYFGFSISCCSSSFLKSNKTYSLIVPNRRNGFLSNSLPVRPVKFFKFNASRRHQSSKFNDSPPRASSNFAVRPTISFSRPQSWWKYYVWLLSRYPWRAQLLSGACLGGLSAIISERVVQKKSFSNIDWSVPGRMFVMGLFVLGPMIRGWFLLLERLFPGTSGLTGLKKMLLDQTLMSPTVFIVFTTCFVMLDPKGGSLRQVYDKLEKDLWTILNNNWKVWPAVQLVNFYFIPFDLRLVFTSAVSLFWNIYIAFMFRSSNMPADVESVKSSSSITTTTTDKKLPK